MEFSPRCHKCGNAEKKELRVARAGMKVMIDKCFSHKAGVQVAGQIAIMPPTYECSFEYRRYCISRLGTHGIEMRLIVEKLKVPVKEKRRYIKCK